MKQEDFLKLHKQLIAEAHELCARKGNDYAGQEDIFRSFNMCDALGICSPTQGILIRLNEKVTRAVQLEIREAKVVAEARRDIVLDIINYACLWGGMWHEKGGLDGFDQGSNFSAEQTPDGRESITNRLDMDARQL